MQTREWYNAVDKSEWLDGPWKSEPDKMQWLDEATRLPCLIVRGPSGALCGYVGVAASHPLAGKSYSNCVKGCGEDYCEHRVENLLEAHGGITFAHACASHSVEDMFTQREHVAKMEQEARRYPKGDSARWLARWRDSGALDNYARYSEVCEATSICHVPSPGEPDNVWWFGFDCAHAGDYIPGAQHYLPTHLRDTLGAPTGWSTVVEYRDIAYVKRECESLARQLKALG